MTALEKLRALVDIAPPDATIPVRWLAALLDGEQRGESPPADVGPSLDLTVAQLAGRLGKGESTVRTWLARGEFPGAYRSHNREWRIPPAAVEAMQKQQRNEQQKRRDARSAGAVDLGAWRQHLPKKGA